MRKDICNCMQTLDACDYVSPNRHHRLVVFTLRFVFLSAKHCNKETLIRLQRCNSTLN